jgi:hypothetical protein
MYSGKHQNIEQDVKEFIKPEILDLPQHTVTITDISEVDLAGHKGLRLEFVTITNIIEVDLAGHDGLRLGQNKV